MTTTSHQTVRLAPGHHRSPDGGEVCVMELASMLAGERFSDHPRAVSPVIAAFLRGYNDGLDDARRQTLKAYASACIGTRTTDLATEQTRRRLIAAHAGGPVSRLAARFWLREGATLNESGAEFIGGSVGRQVAKECDDDRHARILALIDDLIALSEPRATTLEPVRLSGELTDEQRGGGSRQPSGASAS